LSAIGLEEKKNQLDFIAGKISDPFLYRNRTRSNRPKTNSVAKKVKNKFKNFIICILYHGTTRGKKKTPYKKFHVLANNSFRQ
jgi:hypothetical protein